MVTQERDVPFPTGTYVAHTATDVYGPGKVIDEDGGIGEAGEPCNWRRVRFVHFVASVHVKDLRVATGIEAAEIDWWLRTKRRQYGGQW
ncbi:hypothetical protein I3F58_11025 [Streptomyces sp. MUM 203J]|uniref:hypothetical protein n=1 Tax=Streptomyces sp. MUM 203J TaxID=2791990 RepID=UPI001F03C4AC|nr:hypothetical protein [Streptomyces sp. MUM 203J]MCH0540090.1 hypothetical protein [Streptomyces sp. MUM 203J]